MTAPAAFFYLLRRKDGGHVVAYKCRFGDHWHVGHVA